jgi:hypothetical protein
MGHRSSLCRGSRFDSQESIFRFPGNHINISPDPLSQSGIHQIGYARLEIRVLPAREVIIYNTMNMQLRNAHFSIQT